MKIRSKHTTTGILFFCWIVIILQSLYILENRYPDVLDKVGLRQPVQTLFRSVGLEHKNSYFVLSQDEDRTDLKKKLESIDEYSTYLTEDEFESFSIDSKQEYEGIGVSLQLTPKGVYINEVFDGSPAAVAGLASKDLISQLDGIDVRNWEFTKIVSYVRGHQNTSIRIAVARDEQILNFDLRRRAIDIPSVRKIHLTDDGILYLKIDQFGEKTAVEFLKAVQSYLPHPIKGLVIDLRENTGGVFHSSLDILDAFYPKRTVMLKTKATDDDKMKSHRARHKDPLGNIPTIILVNRNTASSSEIVAGSLQVTGRALLIGERTLGKGSIQTVYSLKDGDAYKKTTSYYYLPDGSSIHKVGIRPDIEINLTPELYHEYRTREQSGIAPYDTTDDPYWNEALKYMRQD